MDKNPFNDPQRNRRIASRIWIPRFVAFQILLFVLAVILMFVVTPYFHNYYRKLELEKLPGSTKRVLDAAEYFRNYWYLVLLVWGVLIGGIASVHVYGSQPLSKLLSWLVFCIFTAGFFLSIVALFLPYLSIGVDK